jgi:hypothetical protein
MSKTRYACGSELLEATTGDWSASKRVDCFEAPGRSEERAGLDSRLTHLAPCA